MCCRGGRRAVSLALWDIRTGTGKLWPAGAALACVYAAYWAVMFFMKTDAGPEDRLPVLFVASVFFAFCVPASVYGHINDPADGIGYAMLPVRARIKFAVMLTVSALFFPLCFYTGLHILDCLLTAAGGGKGFSGMIWSTEGGLSLRSFWSDFGKISLYQSVFILGNILLKHHKIAMTVLATLAMHGIFFGLLQIERSGILYFLYNYAGPVLLWAGAYAAFRKLRFC